MVRKKLLVLLLYLFLLFATCTVFISRPSGLRTSNVTLTSVRLDWNAVPERFILGYKVLVQNVPRNETLYWNKTYAFIKGLWSNTEYIISVFPVHGLTDERHLVGNGATIIVTTLREPGKGVCSAHTVSKVAESCESPQSYSQKFSKEVA